MSSLARIGIGVGTAALQSELGMLGIVPAMLPMVEQELNREGLSLGPLANPPRAHHVRIDATSPSRVTTTTFRSCRA